MKVECFESAFRDEIISLKTVLQKQKYSIIHLNTGKVNQERPNCDWRGNVLENRNPHLNT